MEKRSTHLCTWVPADLRQRFAASAAHQGLSESALLRLLIQRSLAVSDVLNLGAPPPPVSRESRTTVRLVPGDRLLLRERAAARGMPAASYVSTLVRAHLRSLSPLPQNELAALRLATSELATLGRNLNTIACALQSGSNAGVPGQEHVKLLLTICEAMHAHVRAIVRTNIASWETGHAQE